MVAGLGRRRPVASHGQFAGFPNRIQLLFRGAHQRRVCREHRTKGEKCDDDAERVSHATLVDDSVHDGRRNRPPGSRHRQEDRPVFGSGPKPAEAHGERDGENARLEREDQSPDAATQRHETHTSKNATRMIMATPPYPVKFMARIDVMMAPTKRSNRMRRGLTNRLPRADNSRPMVKTEWLSAW